MARHCNDHHVHDLQINIKTIFIYYSNCVRQNFIAKLLPTSGQSGFLIGLVVDDTNSSNYVWVDGTLARRNGVDVLYT